MCACVGACMSVCVCVSGARGLEIDRQMGIIPALKADIPLSLLDSFTCNEGWGTCFTLQI